MQKFILCLVAITMSTVAFAQEREPNDQKTLADMVRGLTIQGTMSGSSDVDWFVLNGQEGTRPTFTITHVPSADFDFEVYSDDKSVGRATGSASGDSLTCEVPEKCFVKVWSCHGSGQYQITIAPKSDEREPNDQKSQADTIPASRYEIDGSIANPGDVDWFALSDQEGEHPSFSIEHDPGVDFDFEVYSDDKSVGRATATKTPDNITCDVPGKCWIKVWSCHGTGHYQVGIHPQRTENTDEREPNDEKTQADRIASEQMTIHGIMNEGDDVDWFVLSGQEGRNPTFTITHTDSVDFDFEVYSGDDRVGSAVGANSGDSVTCQVPGTCFVKVWSSHGTGSYEIRIAR